jgi:hypothetical protein
LAAGYSSKGSYPKSILQVEVPFEILLIPDPVFNLPIVSELVLLLYDKLLLLFGFW